jgi:major membrane immunogen (membrane-anchored lipoprotein)
MLPPRSLVAGVVVTAGLLVTACGSSGSPATLNSGRIERAIAQSSLTQRGLRAEVTCPGEVRVENGSVFSCTAVVGHTTTRFAVTQIDGAGHVKYEGQ